MSDVSVCPFDPILRLCEIRMIIHNSLRMGSKGHPETSDISYNIKPHQSPKVPKHQFHRGERLKSQINGCFA
jgi:hypothetical protein